MKSLLARINEIADLRSKYDFTADEINLLSYCSSTLDKIRLKKQKQHQNRKERDHVTVTLPKIDIPATCLVKSLKGGKTKVKIDKEYIVLEIYSVPVVVIRKDGRLYTLIGFDTNIVFNRHANAFIEANEDKVRFPRIKLERDAMMAIRQDESVTVSEMYPKKEQRTEFYTSRFL